jgi:Tfp pilus assembly protein PilF
MGEIRDLGADRDTLVVIVGDHGEGLGQHDELFHCYFTYETTLHVPLVFYCPGTVRSGLTVDSLVRTIDVAPTILDLVGAPPLDGAQGVSLASLISGDARDLQLPAYAESIEGYLHFRLSPMRVFRSGPWKYVLAPEPELFHLDDDPGEEHNLIAQQPEMASDMREQLHALITEAPPPPSGDDSMATLSPNERDALMTLGYLGNSGSFTEEGQTEADLFEPRGADPKDHKDTIKLYARAHSVLTQQQFETAEQLLRQVIEALPESARTYGDLANALQRQGRLEEARSLYEQGLALDPDYTQNRKMYGSLLVQTGQWAQAEAQLARAIKEDPADPESWYNMGRALAAQKKLDKANIHFKRAVTLAPTNADFVHGMGIICVMQGKLPEAAEQFREAIRLDPNDPKPRNDLRRVLEMMGGQ